MAPFPLFPVTTRIIIYFLIGNPYKPSFTTVTGRGPHPRYISLFTTFSTNSVSHPVNLVRKVWSRCDFLFCGSLLTKSFANLSLQQHGKRQRQGERWHLPTLVITTIGLVYDGPLWGFLLNPDAQCMVYLPTFTPKTTQM